METVTSTCMDIPITSGLGNMPEDKMYDWASYQTALTSEFLKTKQGVSATKAGLKKKEEMLGRLKSAFRSRGNVNDYAKYAEMFEKHLEDPGTLENFRFFCVPDSDEMIMFYVNIWSGNMAAAMEYLHRWGKDLKGNYRQSPKNEAWFAMTQFEGIAVNEQLKAKGIAKLIESEKAESICFFGGGNLPERLYTYGAQEEPCLRDMDIVVFETGKTTDVEELSRGEETELLDLSRFHLYYESLLTAANSRHSVRERSHIVTMHGVSMYLGKEIGPMVEALANGKALLQKNGVMSFDYLLLTEGMKRTATAQHWPNAEKMKIFTSVEQAIAEGKATVDACNKYDKFEDQSHFDVESIIINTVKPWGETSVRFLLRKYV